MPVLPEVGSMMMVSFFALAGLDHRHPDAVLDRPQRVEVLQLGDDGRLTPLGDATQLDQRGAADRLGHVVVDPGPDRRGVLHGDLRTGKPEQSCRVLTPPLTRLVYCREGADAT
jgi:hypothetical protein